MPTHAVHRLPAPPQMGPGGCSAPRPGAAPIAPAGSGTGPRPALGRAQKSRDALGVVSLRHLVRYDGQLRDAPSSSDGHHAAPGLIEGTWSVAVLCGYAASGSFRLSPADPGPPPPVPVVEGVPAWVPTGLPVGAAAADEPVAMGVAALATVGKPAPPLEFYQAQRLINPRAA